VKSFGLDAKLCGVMLGAVKQVHGLGPGLRKSVILWDRVYNHRHGSPVRSAGEHRVWPLQHLSASRRDPEGFEMIDFRAAKRPVDDLQ